MTTGPILADSATSASSATGWRRRLVAGFVLMFLALQIGVPTVKLFQESPNRFSWQMYANHRPAPTFWMVMTSGEVQPMDLKDQVAHGRIELDYIPAFPRHVCATHENVSAVRYQMTSASQVEEHPCDH